jgi:lambda family phage portal protein
MLESGEVFTRMRARRPGDLEVPLQLQMLESDHCPLDLNQTLTGGQIRMGIEFNAIDRITAYHFYRYHPYDLLMLGNTGGMPVAVPADVVSHMFEPMRPGQVRGLPRMAPVLVRLYDLEQYNDSELMRKKVASLVAGFVLKSDLAASIAGEGDVVDGIKAASWEPGQLIELMPGEDVKFSEPSDVGDNFEKFEKAQMRKIASAIGLTYEQLTGDLSDVNYSSIRAGLVEFRRHMEAFQHQVVVHRFCRPVWRMWLDQAALAGVIDINDYLANKVDYQSVRWVPQGWQWVDPEKEVRAYRDAVRNGFTTRTNVVAMTGEDAEQVDAEWAAEAQRAKELGNVYETDPSNDADRVQKAQEANG